MINEIKQQKNQVNIEKNIRGTKTPVPQSPKPSVPAPSSAVRSAISLAASAGLPADKLSSSIVSFARFFSLPLKPQLLADIRRQAFMPQPASQTQQSAFADTSAANHAARGDVSASLTAAKNFTDAKGREAFSLAAAAAESKGVELQPKGLESYTDAVDPDSRRHNDEQQQKRNRNKNEQEEKTSVKIESITADSLKNMILKSMENNPLLDILNKLPGKNGQRWIVLPFDFIDGGREFNVSMRILLNEKKSGQADYMALDIIMSNVECGMNSEECGVNSVECGVSNVECGMNNEELGIGTEKREQRWVVVLEGGNEKAVRVTVYLMQGLFESSGNTYDRFRGEIALLLGIPGERVFIKSRTEAFPFEMSFDEPLASVNEVV